MKTKNSTPPPLPPLHEKEEVLIKSFIESDVGISTKSAAEKIIKAIENRVSGRIPRTGWIDLPKNEGVSRGQYHFDPHMLRLDINGETISCFGTYGNDESTWLIQVRFLIKRPPRQAVRFEITSWFNPISPTGIPFLHY